MKTHASLLKVIGGILLIIGTSIGGGMLALPVVTVHGGFVPSAVYLFCMWMAMTLGALLILEVNLWLPANSNMVSMAKSTLGHWGAGLTWLMYLLLLYCLLAAYMAGGSDLVQGLFHLGGFQISLGEALAVFVIIFGGIVTLGIQSIDWVNRLIMGIKILAFLVIILAVFPFVHTRGFTYGSFSALWPTATVMITAFAYAIIIPSLRGYFKDNVSQLRKVVWIGSLIPLVCYIAWEAAIFGAVPKSGQYGLTALGQSHQPITSLMMLLSHVANHQWLIDSAKIFTSICIITAFLGVSLCLVDFLLDGFKLQHNSKQKWIAILLAFVPPVLLVLLLPQLFVKGLSMAGVFCVVLLILIPAAMGILGRKKYGQTSVFLHPALLIITTLIGLALLVFSGWIYFG